MAARKPTPPTTTTTSEPWVVFFPGTPTPASRPRVTRQGWAYYEKTYKAWLKAAQTTLAAEPVHRRFNGPVAVTVGIAVKRPKKPTNPFPRGDVDNYAKGPLDALTKAGVWPDDNCVVKLTVRKWYTSAHEDVGITVVVEHA